MDYTFIAQAVTVLVGVLVTLLVGHKIISPKRLVTTLTYAQEAVHAAEELYRALPDSGQAKFRYAASQLEARTGVSQDEAAMLVNAAVSKLRAMGYLPTGPKTVELPMMGSKKASS